MTKPNHALTFLQEAEDLLLEIETAALTLNRPGSNTEAINQIFRGFHTIKGSGAMFGFDRVAAFTHHVETLLDQVREQTVPVTDELSDVILAANDHIKLLLQSALGQAVVDADVEAKLLTAVHRMSDPSQYVSSPGVELSELSETECSSWRIEFHPDPALLSRGGNPTLLFRDLRSLGPCTVEAHTDSLPPITELNPETCYFWWSIKLDAVCTEADIRDVFIFAEGDSQLVIAPLVQARPANARTPDAVSVEAQGTGLPAEISATDLNPQPITKEATVRVPADRLDRLVNLVGELVMNQSRLARAALAFQSSELAGPVEEIDRLVSELRDDVLQIRMMPIGTIFGRFRRLIRDLSQQLGKEVDLVTEGEETELDKSILDQLAEPLVHLLRNSMDHGLERPAVRREAGKSARGRIRLSALHRGSDVMVKIEDDGAGLNREAIRAKAIARQLIQPDANLSDKEIVNLILLPGFSTAQAVTNISGRGVGMDAVKRQIDALSGSLHLVSQPGQGTSVTLTLPLTLAIIDGLLVEIADSQYIVPMAVVMENVELRQADRRLNNGRNIVAVRGELIPFIDLRWSFRIPGSPPEISKIVIVRYEDKRVGFAVDRVMGTHQTVIQALGPFFRKIGSVSGSTVMGDGRVALILDIAGIVSLVSQQQQLLSLGEMPVAAA